ncbi:MAG TPA: PAAR domain-containing protein [Chthoniobacteraceae bacterium]|nr:PAAR domain-containing protein [Chthoniobacteraceae bacterium]
MPPAARLFDLTSHGTPLSPGPGSLDVIIGGLPAWRGVPAGGGTLVGVAQEAAEVALAAAALARQAASITPFAAVALAAEGAVQNGVSATMSQLSLSVSAGADQHFCPVPRPHPPHGDGVVINGSPTVFINGLHACRVGDIVLEAIGGPDPIAVGCLTVFIGGEAGGPGSSLREATQSLLNRGTRALIEITADFSDFVAGLWDGVGELATSVEAGLYDASRDLLVVASPVLYDWRDALNGPVPSPSELIHENGWWQTSDDEAQFHQPPLGPNGEKYPKILKFVNVDGREAVFYGVKDPATGQWVPGEPVTDPRYRATYNFGVYMPAEYYGRPRTLLGYEVPQGLSNTWGIAERGSDWVDHAVDDVVPYIVFGASLEDDSHLSDRARPITNKIVGAAGAAEDWVEGLI